MKIRLFALALFATTVAAVGLYPGAHDAGALTATPPAPGQGAAAPARIEVVFVLDTTGSMSGLIAAAKEKIWSIATTMAAAQPAPEIRMGLVAYRDRGDVYVTETIDLSADLDTLYARLMDFEAGGGGDGPESVNQALHDAVHRIAWSPGQEVYKVVFLVGDAPPHVDYQDDVPYAVTVAAARARGIVINAIQCGQDGATTPYWRELADLGDGEYFQVDQNGSAVAIVTPFDERLATLSAELDDTRLYYGSAAEREQGQRKIAATDKLHAASSVASRARRAAFNASPSGQRNLIGEGDLVGDVASGRVALATIEPASLPEPLQAMTPAEQRVAIAEKAEQRAELSTKIAALTKRRAAYLDRRVAASGVAGGSLDTQIYDAVRAQAAAKGLDYKDGAPAY